MTQAELVGKLKERYKAAYGRYRDTVLHGRKACGKAERMKVWRQEQDVKKGVDGYVFSLDAGLRPLVWITLNLVFPSGDKRGEPMELADWQAYDIIVLFGWVRDEAHPFSRRYIDAFIEVARKNGKSTLAGAILDYLIFGEKDGVQGYIGASVLDQAKETFDRAADSLKLAHKGEVKVMNSKNNKVIRYKSGTITAIPSKPLDGKLAYGTIIDEYHQHPDNALINSIRSGNLSDQVPMLIRITTAGVSLNGVCHEEYKKCKRILGGSLDIPRYFVSIYEADRDDSPDDPSIWEKANPCWGVSVTPELFRSTYDYAKASESDMLEFKTKNLNMWCNSLRKWCNLDKWAERCHWRMGEDELRGRLCFGAIDLAKVSDFTAFTADFPVGDGRHMQITRFWIPEASVAEIERACKIPLRNWIKEGYVTATEGDTTDYGAVAAWLTEFQEAHQLAYIAVDRWHIDELVREMPSWFTQVAYEFNQGLKSMSPAVRDYERTYLEGLVSANGNPVIDWMLSCAEAWTDANDNVKLVKPRYANDSRIDGVITSVMALSNARTHDLSAFTGDVSQMISMW